MASWSDIGHGMRRRMGAPSNHVEATGVSMSRSHATSNEAMEAHSAGGSARATMGMDAYSVQSTGHMVGTQVPRKNTQAGDPTYGGKENRPNVLERMGATYRVNASMGPQHDPTAGPTMANSRIVPSIQGRANPNFESGMQTSY
jgi:hypothetical protein